MALEGVTLLCLPFITFGPSYDSFVYHYMYFYYYLLVAHLVKINYPDC